MKSSKNPLSNDTKFLISLKLPFGPGHNYYNSTILVYLAKFAMTSQITNVFKEH